MTALARSEEFSWLVWNDPRAVLDGLPRVESTYGLRRAGLHARYAIAWFGLLCPAEAQYHAEQAIALGVLHDPAAHALCLGVLALAARATREPSADQWRREQLAVVSKADLVYSDAHVRALINGLNFVENIDEAHATYKYALDIWSRTKYMNRQLRTSRRLLIEYTYNNWVVATDASTAIARLLAVMDEARAADEKVILALGHQSLGEIYRAADLYSIGLLHASIAVDLWRKIGQSHRVAETLLIIAKLYQSLGLTTQAEEVLNEVHGLAIGSRGQYIESERLTILAELKRFQGDSALSLRYARSAAQTAPAATFGGITPIWASLQLMLHAYLLGDTETVNEARRMLATIADRLDPKDPFAVLARYATAILSDDQAAASEQATIFRERWPDYRSPAGVGFDEIIAVFDKFQSTLRIPDPMRADLMEYWDHIVHLSGEDDERIRGHYRVGNCLPVLHRILASGRPELTPELQFELVELARFGAVSSLLSSLGAAGEERTELRGLARNDLLSQGIRFPAVYGEPSPLSIDGRATPLAEISGRSPTDVSSLLDMTSADVLQLYLRGHTLHWFYRTPGSSGSHGAIVLPRPTVRILNSFSSLLTPRIGPFEAHIAADLGLGDVQLRAVAAARTAAGPMAELPELASDLLRYLGKPERRKVWAAIRDLSVPTVGELAAALGELVPERVFDQPANSVLFVSLDLALAPLPLMLASRDHGPLVAHRLPVILPPINLLAAAPRVSPLSVVADWTTTRIGNAVGDLSFAGPASSEDEIVNAIIVQDAEFAGRQAVVYRGHLAEPPPGSPSEAGLFLGPGRVLQARALLEEARGWYAPARLALLACRAAGWDLGGEWGGIAAAEMLRGSTDVIAPLWPLIDAAPAARLDEMITGLIGIQGQLSAIMQDRLATAHDNWISRAGRDFPPHWWASLVLTSR